MHATFYLELDLWLGVLLLLAVVRVVALTSQGIVEATLDVLHQMLQCLVRLLGFSKIPQPSQNGDLGVNQTVSGLKVRSIG